MILLQYSLLLLTGILKVLFWLEICVLRKYIVLLDSLNNELWPIWLCGHFVLSVVQSSKSCSGLISETIDVQR